MKFSKYDKVLFSFAHADDESISAAGLMHKLLKQNIEVYALWFTSSLERDSELLKAIDILEITSGNKLKDKLILNFPDTKLINHIIDIKNQIERWILSNGITHSISHCIDTNPDHVALSQANEMAGRTISTWEFETPNAFNFVPSCFVPLTSDEVDVKLEMMLQHKSQNNRNNGFYLKKIRSTAEFRGLAIYQDFAEAYFPKRIKFE